VLDPLYLAARGAKLGDLYAMGAMLEAPQRLCTEAEAALLVVTHHNRGEGRGAHRLTGTGPAEWGRVLINATVISRSTRTQRPTRPGS
jgi:RecA-family ATPase